MGDHFEHVDALDSIIYRTDEPVIVSAYIEDNLFLYIVGASECPAHICEGFPNGRLRYINPVRQWLTCVGMSLGEGVQLAFVDDFHPTSLGYHFDNLAVKLNRRAWLGKVIKMITGRQAAASGCPLAVP